VDDRIEARRVELASRFAFLSDCTGRTPAQAAIRWLLDLPGVSSVVPGIRTPEQAEESMGASACPPITESERVRVREVRARP